ncbi:phosphoenolpyruvate--protein phosphotransferase [Vibrio sp. TH_r3]|uniref:phosphoenolpyruvate--protein phosphotransferase n=1 Tax=Vibrio sp. TH_r3 TaxID=3082084 RepID=UPI002954A497|nr:phosphoenolpyruvate--protein phosphotransferase [Vibrio sp. TH_r3]MDV7104979.1 phosphoenolpyruvate--protein phosphotransferase [Vibrio sp. TH_r3]
MVSIVIVSHSKQLAEGVLELAQQMSQGKVVMTIAAGVDDPDNPIGTDAIAIMTAIDEVFSTQGVLVLVDMGSAILSTDMALELLEPEQANVVHVCAAPLIEGTMAASVAAAAGMPMQQVIDETNGAIVAKYQLLQQSSALAGAIGTPEHSESTSITLEDSDIEDEQVLSFSWQVQNPNGIHARPASEIVTLACDYEAKTWLVNGDKVANARSLNSVALLTAKQNDTIAFKAQGKDAQQAINAFSSLAESHFGESLEPALISQQTSSDHKVPLANVEPQQEGSMVVGIAASDGISIAPALCYRTVMPPVPQREIGGLESEMNHVTRALEAAHVELQTLINDVSTKVSVSDAEIFKAHQQMLSDPELINQVKNNLIDSQVIAEKAWIDAINQMADAYNQTGDSYLMQRANDIFDIGRRVMQIMVGEQSSNIVLEQASILFASDLSPSDTAQLDPSLVKGLCLEKGGNTSHSAILARSLGIPAVVGVDSILEQVQEGCEVILDGYRGTICLNPTCTQLEENRQQITENLAKQQQDQAVAQLPAVTKDGKCIEVFANLATLEDVDKALENGAEGVGLLRSEFLFMDSAQPPTEEEQVRFYSKIAQSFEGKTVIVRTLDIGGDKPLQYLQQNKEDNPFLGCRGIRLCLKNSDVFKTQLKALLRTRAQFDNIKIMFPMIATVEELLDAKSMIADMHQQLTLQGQASLIPAIGIMIEVPAAVVNAKHLAQHVDFFSIGTNDLTQYVMAADRGNESVAYLTSTHQPAVLNMIQTAVNAAHSESISVGVCGEMAGDPRLTSLLVGLGVDELSMSSVRIAAVKARVRATNLATSITLAENVLVSATLAEVDLKVKSNE